MGSHISTVLGAKGLVGSRLVSALRQQEKTVWSPGRSEQGQIFKKPLGTVYYCIGLTADFRQRPYDTVEAHVSLLSRLLERADFERLVYLSSTRLYDALGAVNATEDTSFNFSVADPRHLYDLSKALGENLCLNSSGGRASVARLSCVIGKQLEDEGFVPNLLNSCFGNRHVEIDSSPHFERDYIGLDDVVTLLISIAERGKQAIYNVASGLNVSNSSIFELITQMTGCEIHAALSTSGKAPLINVQRVQEEFGFNPIGIEMILTELLALRKLA
jgi:UDP-glucose 4-epimerase